MIGGKGCGVGGMNDEGVIGGGWKAGKGRATGGVG